MPTYSYFCKCKFKKEEYKSISKRNEIVICPKCGQEMIRLIENGSGFNLKGNGWYKGGWNQ